VLPLRQRLGSLTEMLHAEQFSADRAREQVLPGIDARWQ